MRQIEEVETGMATSIIRNALCFCALIVFVILFVWGVNDYRERHPVQETLYEDLLRTQ
jgi:hypothetical protein